MVNIVRYDCRPDLHRPIFIEGLPGVGNVGKIAADLIKDEIHAKRFARVFSEDLPPQVMLDDECVGTMVSHELWYAEDVNGHDIILLLGDHQGTTPIGQYRLSKDVFDIIIPYDPSMIVTLGGYGIGTAIMEPRVLGAVSDPRMKSGLEKHGVTFSPGEPKGGIVGAAAVFLGLGGAYGIDSVCIMGETSGYIVDFKSARNVVDVLGSILGVTLDTSSLQIGIDQVDEITSVALKEEPSGPEEDLTYIR